MSSSFRANVFTGKVMSPTEAAYVAGVIDGEGTVALYALKTKASQQRRSLFFLAVMKMGNTDLPLVEKMVELTGNGRISVEDRGLYKTFYIWQLTPNQIRHVLPQLAPYLVTRRKRAELLLEYLQLIGKRNGSVESDIPRLQSIYDELAELNQRNIVRRPSKGEVVLRIPRKETFRPCAEDGCEAVRYREEDYCYQHWLNHRDPNWKTCEHCGKQMDAIMPHKRYCNTDCQHRAYYRRTEAPIAAALKYQRNRKVCRGCGEFFLAGRSDKEFCGRPCYLRLRRVQEFAKENGLPVPEQLKGAVRAKDLGFARNCKICGAEFTARSPKAELCSDACKKARKNAAEREIRRLATT